MNIAICDDDKEDLFTLYTVLHNYDLKGQFQISQFSSSSALLSASKNTQFDIVFLDIEMSAPNGYEAALELRKYSTPPIIIFVTISQDYAIPGYKVAFDYIPKPLTLKKLSPVLDAAIERIRANRFIFTVDGVSHILHIQDISYIEVFNHVTKIHTIDGEYSLRSSLKNLLAQLPQGHFGMPHQSYIVNFFYIKNITAREIVLINNERLPISRRYHDDFRNRLFLYLGR